MFMETWMAGGYGRAQGGYDEMVFRAKVRDNATFYSPLGLEAEGTQIDFQVGVNDYLYGTRFFSYLGLTYGPEKVIAWLRRDEGSAGYPAQFKRVFGKPLDAAWQDWIAWEQRFQTANLASVQAYPATPSTPVAKSALGSISRGFLTPDGKSLVGAFRTPGVISDVGVLTLNDGRIRRLADIKGAMIYRVTSLAYDADAGKAYYTADNYAFRDLMEVDVSTGKSRMLLRDARIGDIVLNPKDHTLWGLRHLNGLVTLVRLDPPYAGLNCIHTAYGEIPFDLDIFKPDGDAAVRVHGPGGRRPVGPGLQDRGAQRGAAGSGVALALDPGGGSGLLARRQVPVRFPRAITPGSRTSTAMSSPPERRRRCRTLSRPRAGRQADCL